MRWVIRQEGRLFKHAAVSQCRDIVLEVPVFLIQNHLNLSSVSLNIQHTRGPCVDHILHPTDPRPSHTPCRRPRTRQGSSAQILCGALRKPMRGNQIMLAGAPSRGHWPSEQSTGLPLEKLSIARSICAASPGRRNVPRKHLAHSGRLSHA